jgi:hypothetical protein
MFALTLKAAMIYPSKRYRFMRPSSSLAYPAEYYLVVWLLANSGEENPDYNVLALVLIQAC